MQDNAENIDKTEAARSVWMTIRGKQSGADEEDNQIELSTEGTIRRDGESVFLSYVESEIVGTDGCVMIIELEGGNVRLTRSGEYGMNFDLAQGRKCMTLYTTPFGVMEMSAYPTLVRYEANAENGFVELNYQLEIQGKHISNNHLHISWREARM